MDNTPNIQNTQHQEETLKEYQEQGDKIIRQMLNVLMRSQKKVDNEEYNKWLETIKQNSN